MFTASRTADDVKRTICDVVLLCLGHVLGSVAFTGVCFWQPGGLPVLRQQRWRRRGWHCTGGTPSVLQ